MGHFLAFLAGRAGAGGPPVQGIHIPHVFDVLTIRNLMYADGLLGLLGRKKHDARQLTRVSDTDSSLEFKTAFSGTQHKKIAEHSRREAEVETAVAVAEAALHARQLRGIGAVDVAFEEIVGEYQPQFEIFWGNLTRNRTVANKRDSAPVAAKAESGPFYLTSNSIYGSGRSSIALYGMNYKLEAVISASRSADRAAAEEAGY